MSTRPRTSWSDLRNATVGVWGLGVEGRASVARLATMGTTPVLVDDRSEAAGAGEAVLPTRGDGLAALLRCDVVVKAPGISRYRPEVARLQGAGVTVVGGLGLWLEEAPRERVACITGTKGKSTTSAVAGHLLGRLGYGCLVGGNIGQPPWDPDVGDDHGLWVVETSSFQATDLASSPAVVAVTALHPDHLDWHGDTETYYRDKLSACHQPGASLTVANGASRPLRDRRELLGPDVRWIVPSGDADDVVWSRGLGLAGEHNLANARIARAVLEALGVPEAADPSALAEAADGFPALPSRLQHIGAVSGVDFVDDSLATNVLPALAALEAFADRRVALLAGGWDRGIDYTPLAEGIARRDLATLVVTMAESGHRIARAVAGHPGRSIELVKAPDLHAATRTAFAWAEPDGVVLLSPASPSFGAFHDFRERSAAFAAAMRACRPSERA